MAPLWGSPIFRIISYSILRYIGVPLFIENTRLQCCQYCFPMYLLEPSLLFLMLMGCPPSISPAVSASFDIKSLEGLALSGHYCYVRVPCGGVKGPHLFLRSDLIRMYMFLKAHISKLESPARWLSNCNASNWDRLLLPRKQDSHPC